MKPFQLLVIFSASPILYARAEVWPAGTPPTPFDTLNGNPFQVLLGPPSWYTSGLASDARGEFSLQHSLSNSRRENEAGTEIAAFDSETGVTTFSARIKLPGALESYLNIPWITQSAGQLDSMIYNWHEWFGLPQGKRTRDTNDQFQLRYWEDEQSILASTEPSRALGDTRLGLVLPLDGSGFNGVVQSELRLPTGSAEELSGTGALGVSLGLGAHTSNDWLGSGALWYGGLGLSWNELGDTPLAYRQKSFMVSGRGGAQWQWFPACLFKIQLDSNSPAYDSDLKELGGVPLQLTAGLTFGLAENWWGDFTVTEDLNPGASSDFTTAFRVKYLWNRN